MTDPFPTPPPPPPTDAVDFALSGAEPTPNIHLDFETAAGGPAPGDQTAAHPAEPAAPPPHPMPVVAATAGLPPPLPHPTPTGGPAAAAEPLAKKPEWKVLEPADRHDPTEHEVWTAAAAQTGWQVVAASVRGKLHAHKGQWREDSFAWGTAGGWTVLAVSDGAGSARLSRLGARVACDTAVSHLRTLLTGYALGPGERQPADSDLQRVREFLKAAAEKARAAVLTEARNRSAPAKDFSATLLLSAVAPWADRHLVAVFQAGDGAVGVFGADGAKRLGVADHGEYSSETRFLTTPGMELEYANRVVFSLPAGLTAVALMSDGVSDDFYPEDKRIGEVFGPGPIDGLTGKDGGPLLGLFGGVTAAPRGGAALRDWLRYERRGSSDDRTLVLLHRSAP